MVTVFPAKLVDPSPAALCACAEPPATEPVARGRQVYRALQCAACHRIGTDGGNAGPDLTRIGSVAEGRLPGTSGESYLRGSVGLPGAYVVPGHTDTMPRGLTDRLPKADLDALIAFLQAQR